MISLYKQRDMKHMIVLNVVLVCVLLAVIVHTYMLISQTSATKEPYMESVRTLNTPSTVIDIDPQKTTCLNYVQTQKNWTTMFGKDEDGLKRQYAITGFKVAQGDARNERGNIMQPFFDACVIPTSLLKQYNIDENCKFTSQEGDITLQKTITNMTPKGCMIDFSGKIGGNRSPIHEKEFKDMLMKFFNYMNTEDEKVISTLKTEETEKQNRVVEQDQQIGKQDTKIKDMNKELITKSDEIFLALGEKPSYTHDESAVSWYTPKHNHKIGLFRNLGINSATKMSITFWIDYNVTNLLKRQDPIRNILHISKKPSGNIIKNLLLNFENMYRRPAIYVYPNSFKLYVTQDTTRMSGEGHLFPFVWKKSMVGLVWSGTTLTMYVNGRSTVVQYRGIPVTAEPDADVYLCDRFNDNRIFKSMGYKLRFLTFYNTALTKQMITHKYTQEQALI